MSIITDTIDGKATTSTVQESITQYIKTAKTYMPELDFRLKLEISGANIIIEDDPRQAYSGLDMDFDVVKSYENSRQTSTIKIYNMSVLTYNLIYEKGEVFRLSCARGQDSEYTPFYTGQAVSATKVGGKTILTKNQGFMAQDANAGRRGQNDLVTEITLVNVGGFPQLFKSYQSAVSTEVIIDDCRKAMGLPFGEYDKSITHVMKPAGTTIKGSVAKTLDNLSGQLGFTWNCNDMALNIYNAFNSELKTYGVILNPKNSNTPERLDDKFQTTSKIVQKSDKKKGIPKVKETYITREKQGFKIETMLLPFLQVGSTVHLDFPLADAQGDKYVYKVHHVGSNVGTNCITEVYCV